MNQMFPPPPALVSILHVHHLWIGLERKINGVEKCLIFLSLHGYMKTVTVIKISHYLDQLSLPDHLCAFSLTSVLILYLLVYDVTPFRFARHL